MCESVCVCVCVCVCARATSLASVSLPTNLPPQSLCVVYPSLRASVGIIGCGLRELLVQNQSQNGIKATPDAGEKLWLRLLMTSIKSERAVQKC